MYLSTAIFTVFSAGPVVSKSDPQLTTTAEDVRPQYGDVAEKTEMTDSTVIVRSKDVPRKPLSSHRPDDEVPGAAAIIENLEVGTEFILILLFPFVSCGGVQ